jgi:hypothetical protein
MALKLKCILSIPDLQMAPSNARPGLGFQPSHPSNPPPTPRYPAPRLQRDIIRQLTDNITRLDRLEERFRRLDRLLLLPPPRLDQIDPHRGWYDHEYATQRSQIQLAGRDPFGITDPPTCESNADDTRTIASARPGRTSASRRTVGNADDTRAVSSGRNGRTSASRRTVVPVDSVSQRLAVTTNVNENERQSVATMRTRWA